MSDSVPETMGPANRPGPGRAATQFKPGQSGNPSGRPKVDSELLAALEQVVNKTELAKKLWALVEKGDMAATRYVYDRLMGSPAQTVTHKGSEQEPIHVRHSPRDSAD